MTALLACHRSVTAGGRVVAQGPLLQTPGAGQKLVEVVNLASASNRITNRATRSFLLVDASALGMRWTIERTNSWLSNLSTDRNTTARLGQLALR